MAARHLVVLATIALGLLLPFPSNAEFLNEDLVFAEEPASPPRWRTVRHKRTVYQEINSLDSPLLEHSSDSESDRGLWNSAVQTVQRIKRNLWDSWGWGDDTTTAVSETTSDTDFTSDPLTSNTLSRDTRSTDDTEQFNRSDTHDDYLASLKEDDDDFNIGGGTSGDSSGEPPSTEAPITPDYLPTSFSGPTSQRVYHRVTITVHEPFREEYADRNSDLFKDFSKNFSKAVDELFEDTPGTQKSGVIKIEKSDSDPFQLIVTSDISSEFYNNPNEIKRKIEDHIRQYRTIGGYAIFPENFNFVDYGEREEPKYTDEPFTRPCAAGEIECDTFTGEACLTIEARCNGTRECQSGLDEIGCPPTITEPSTTTTTSTTTEASTSEPSTRGLVDRCRADDKVRCADGSAFICVDQKCDGKPDCPGGDDELDCPTEDECGSEEFLCDFSRCIPQNEVCDGVPQCSDNADELNCPPTAQVCDPRTQFECEDRSCIDVRLRCDNQPDCPQAEDEKGCPSVLCSPSQSLCRDGRGCVDRGSLCNGYRDCADGSDEEYCPGSSHTERPACDPRTQFECEDKRCIDVRLRCNNITDCPLGADERDCPRTTACSPDQFQCRDGRGCVDVNYYCDGRPDCADLSDEEYCPKPACDPQRQFECSDKTCVDVRLRCDGKVDCPVDGSDEWSCTSTPHVTCRPDQFRCTTKDVCIDRNLLCNQIYDCQDGSDEDDCDTCQKDQYRCSNGLCLPLSVLCNGRRDCAYGEDELNCAGSSCQPYEWQCHDGSCIREAQKCDGYPDCRDNSDEDACGNPVHCMANEFRCNDGSCIQAAYQCDNVTDCPDRSDELDCRLFTCGPNELTCGDGKCVPRYLECDGTPDCRDGADERNCPLGCRSDEFSCDGGRCVQVYKKCDRVADCSDGTDEANCGPTACRADEFRCGDGSCIPFQRRCDGRSVDCRDGSDERNCPQSGSTVTDRPPVPPPVVCPPGQLACLSGDQCVPQTAYCDNSYDCRDYSDEGNCAGNPEGLNLKTYPNDQIIKESREVVFQCRDEGPLRASVRWTRGDGLPLPPGSRDIKGRLEMPNIQLEHTGTYVCEAIGFSPSTPGSRASVYLKVEPFEQLPTPTHAACAFNEATCSNGDCISKNQVCDGRYDCTDGSDELRCNPHGCEPNEFRCDNKKCVQKTWRCDADDDCGDGSDERNCDPSPPGSTCRYNEYQCARGDQCIPKAFHCDMEVDCQDGSDEFGCTKAEIVNPPPSMVVKQPGETFTITCYAVGVPTPEIVWRLNWGHIPPKCQTTSVGGRGTLTCPNIQETDQGAYSCEALNNRGSKFAIPDSILVVKAARTNCSEGTFNELARSPDECISCFCFGVSTSCRSADLYIYQLPPPLDTYKVVNVYIPPGGGLDIRKGDSQFQTSIHPTGQSGFQISLTDNELKSSYYTPVYPYFALPENYLGNQLKSYGGYIKYTVKSDGTSSPLSIPDIILTGNGYTLVFKGAPINPRVENNIAVHLFPGNWYRVQDARREYKASRQDLMMALEEVDQLLIRTHYFSDGLETTITDISMDSAAYTNIGQGQAAYVEQCDCPVGYTGLSCESCASGYKHQPGGAWLGTCEGPIQCPPMYYKDPRDNRCKPCACPHTDSPQFGTACSLDYDLNITCVCPPGYEGRNCEKCSYPYFVGNPLQGEPCVRKAESECDPAGSKSSQLDPYSRQCQCKELTTGRTCNQCKPNTFNLASNNQFGCISCFCAGINTTCTSSDLYRTQVVSAFTRDNQNFKLAEANRLNDMITDIQLNPSAQEIYFQQFNPGTYYWVLPSKFLHNKVTSYGGYLKYTFRYIPTPGGQSSPNNAPDVEIVSDNGVRLVYYNRQQPLPEPNRPVTVAVPLLEQYWERVDGAKANRDMLMMGLAELSSILIKATYTTTTQEAALLSVSLDTATDDRNTGQSRAVEVELCQCPPGYRGPSCEECEAGYTRIAEGLYLGVCEPCSCNGYSSECDPDTGACMNCRGNTRGDKCDQCIDGYRGNPATGVPCTPEGQTCYCDPRGSISTSCDPNSQLCPCKTNVIGSSCSECRRGTFDLSESNIDGCIECYCSGVSGECQSSNMYREAIPMQIVDQSHQFTLTDPNRRVVLKDGFILNPSLNEIGYDFTNQRQQRLFWSLPPQFTGNKVLSYGGNLNFTQRYTALPGPPPSLDTDVIIVGPSLQVYWTDDEIVMPNTNKVTSIPLKENKWRRLDVAVGQRPASRGELMRVLSNVQAILIRATYSTHTETSYLSDVSLDTAVSQRTAGPVASQVEVCRCPPGYKGTSCELCSVGYYQDFDNTCKKCPCNGNEEYCVLNPQQQVVCTCKPSFGGTYCNKSTGVNPRPSPQGQPTISIAITDPTVIVIEAGKEVVFRCTGRSLVTSKPVALEWTKENGYLPVGRAYDNKEGVLVIRDVQTSDSGTYICTASDGFTFVTEKALLNVGGSSSVIRPVVTVTPRSLEVREGEPVEFQCEATGVPTPTLQWVGDRSNKLPPQSSFASGRFRIPHANLQDEGMYTCTARNSAGDDSETVALHVRSAPPTPPPVDVRLNIYPQDYNGIAGQTVRLECRASNPRNIRLQWSRQDGIQSLNARDSDGIFTIYNSQPSDSGVYTCTAVERTTGQQLQEVRIRVSVSPPQRPQPSISIEPPRQTVPQGSLAELRCFTNDGPVQWSKAGDELPVNSRIEGNVLKIDNIQVKDRGVYVCQVEGPGGLSRVTSVIEVERREQPVIELYPKGSQTLTEGESAIFHCRIVKGIPEPTLQWSRVDGKPLPVHVEQMPNGALRFNSVTREDEGQYLCTADNQEGSATTVAVLEVHSMPRITIMPPGQTIKVSPNQRVRLDCRATGHPQPTVFWSKHEQGHSFYEPKSITPETPQGAVYEILRAAPEHEGSYTCTARNTAGDVEERIHLTVSDEQTTSGPGRGDIPSSSGVLIPDDDYTIPLGGHVTIRCLAQAPQKIYLDWKRRDGRPLGASSQVRDGTLYINQAQYSDEGDYECQGIDDRGTVLFSTYAYVKVIVPMQIKLDPQRQVVRPGDNARITCSATGEQPIYISWNGGNNQPLPRSVRVSGGIIEFNGITTSDAGRYVCRAQDQRGGVLEATADVIVNDNRASSSTLRAVDRNPTAIEGTSINLRCDTPDHQQILWSREDRALSGRAVVDGPALRIDKVQIEDSGRYICRTTAYGTITQDYIDLRVERVNDIELQIEPSSRDVHYGDTVDLQCRADSSNVKIYWSRADGTNLPANARSTGEVLRISSATSDNSGTYRCTAILNNNRYDKDYFLSVLDDRPTHDAASAETVTAEYGQTVVLECAIDLEGDIHHTWAKHGGVLPSNAHFSGPHLTISSVTYKDAGLYICTANNGNIQADIPKIILVRGAVPFFNQAPLSYLALPTLAGGYLNFSIEITFKPENPNGLILYNGQQYGGHGDFISFGLRDGKPEFRFDVGSGLGFVRGSQSLALGQWHTVTLNRVKKEGSMYFDDGQFYSNSSSGRMQGLDLSQPLFLGGVPDFSSIHRQNGFESGFVGCISRLVINNKEEIDIMKEQKDSEGVTSCETCAVNPCVNSGVCQEAPTRAGYTCLCPRGFSGLNCSHVGEPCYPGACGTGRCIDADEGMECYCGLGKAGEHCDRDVSITEPSFSGNSYLAYPTPKTLNKLKIALKFNPADDSNGLLMYCAENDDGTGKFISLSIRDRHIEFKFASGTGTTVLRSIDEIVPGQWVTVNVGLGGREASLSVLGQLPVSEAVRVEVLRFITLLYIGGYNKQRVRPAMGVGVRQGFRGCVAEVQVTSLNLDLLRSVVDSANIEQCSASARLTDPCQLRPCLNNGVCHSGPDGKSYQCSCPTGFSGQNCESEQDLCAVQQPCQNGGSCVGTSTSYKCNCPIGWSGTNCEQRTEFKREVSFNGDGYVELPKSLLPHTRAEEGETIHIEFSTSHPDGLLLWHGQTPEIHGSGQDYLSLAVVNGYLQLSYELGSQPAVITSKVRVDDGVRHSAVIKRQGKDGTLELDRSDLEFGESGGLLTQLNTEGNIYVGGLPNAEHMTGSRSVTGLVGCVHSLQVQDSGVIDFAEKAVSSVNVLPCPSATSLDENEDDYDYDGRGEEVN